MKPVLSRSRVNFRVIRDALVIDLLTGPGSGGPEEAQKLQIVNAGGEPPHIPVQVGADVAGIENVGIGILPADQCRYPSSENPLKDGRQLTEHIRSCKLGLDGHSTHCSCCIYCCPPGRNNRLSHTR